MPTIRRKTKVFHVLAGRRVPAGTAGAERVRQVQRKWYGAGVPGRPADYLVPLCADKAAARRMLEDLVRRAERGLAGVMDPAAARRPLLATLDDFAADLAAGLASRSRTPRRPSPGQVAQVLQRVRACLDGCRFRTPADVGPAAARTLSKYLSGRLSLAKKSQAAARFAGTSLHASGFGPQTAEFHLAAMRRFAHWLPGQGLPVDPTIFDKIAGFDPKAGRVHDRRAGTPAELGRLLVATRASGRTRFGLGPEDRYHLYLLAVATGYRLGELARLTQINFILEGPTPVVTLRPARHAKNKRPATQPVTPAVAAEMRAYLATRPPSGPVWPAGSWPANGANMLAKDLRAAGVEYVRDDGHGPKYLDFHALRHTYVTLLAAGGASPKELQELARHTDPRLTLGVYTHADGGRLAEAVGRMPALTAAPATPPAPTLHDLATAGVLLAGLFAVLFGSENDEGSGQRRAAGMATPAHVVGSN